MSGFEKLDKSELGLQKLKTFLLRRRERTPPSSDTDVSQNSYDYDFDQSFEKLLKEHFPKKHQLDSQLPKMDKENIPLSSVNMMTQSSDRCATSNPDDSTIVEDPAMSSFLTIEKMCEKTFSDPNNTIHAYLSAKEERDDVSSGNFRFNCNSENEKTPAIKKLFRLGDITSGVLNKFNLVDQTQLNDIEAPSGMWNDTIESNDISSLIAHTSPVKMVGLLRHSTIHEESVEGISSADDQSFESAQIYSSEQYDTASEFGEKFKVSDGKTIPFSHRTSAGFQNPSSSDASSSNFKQSQEKDYGSLTFNSEHSSSGWSSKNESADVFSGIKKHKFFTEHETSSLKLNSEKDNGTENFLGHTRCSLENARSSKEKDVNVFAKKKFEDLNKLVEFNDSLTAQPSATNCSSSNFDKDSLDGSGDLRDSHEATYSLVLPDMSTIEISDNESISTVESAKSENENLDRTNNGIVFSNPKSESESLRVSRQFNDTIEEMDYFLQQGMKCMEEKGGASQTSELKASTMKTVAQMRVKTPSPFQSPATPNTVLRKVKRPINYNSQQKPAMIYHATPEASGTRIPRPKSHLKNPYEYVQSPVGAYIKNTPSVPLTQNICVDKKVGCQSKALRELQFEAKGRESAEKDTKPTKFSFVSRLPKKAYFSSEYKHVVDQRSHKVIPGGNKIHQYLQPTTVAAVIRHDGRVKANLGTDEGQNSGHPDFSIDSSAADLSIVSGNLSYYTVLDAKRASQWNK